MQPLTSGSCLSNIAYKPVIVSDGSKGESYDIQAICDELCQIDSHGRRDQANRNKQL